MSKEYVKPVVLKAEPKIDETEVVLEKENELEELRNKVAEPEGRLGENTSVVVEEKPKNVNEYLEERVPFYAFQDNDKYKDDIVVGINGYNYVIKRGSQVMIPRFVLMAIMDSERQRMEANKHSSGLADKFYNESKMRGMA